MHEHHVRGLLSLVVAILISAGAYLVTQESNSNISSPTFAQISSIGTQAGVEDNGLNTLAADLAAKEESLRQREEQSLSRERWTIEKERNNANSVLYLSLGGMILLLLIIANFYFEYEIRQKDKKEIEALRAEIRHGFEV